MRIGLRCDAHPAMGVGHLVRQLALAEEFGSRGDQVVLLGDASGVPWAMGQVAARGLRMTDAIGPHGFADQCLALGLDAVMLDGYHLPPALGAGLRAARIPTATMVDGPFGLDQIADLYVDQNLGAVVAPEVLASGARMLVGPHYALLRNVVLARREATAARWAAGPVGRPRVLVVFGGTDAFGGCAVLVPLILATGLPVDVIAVAARAEVAEALGALVPGPEQSVEAIPPVDDLAALLVTCDAAISAAGTSVWELLCLGVPTGVVCVTDNQRVGYDVVAESGVCLGVGMLEELRARPAADDAGIDVLRRLIGDAVLRSRLSSAGLATVDGCGRVRVADAIAALVRG